MTGLEGRKRDIGPGGRALALAWLPASAVIQLVMDRWCLDSFSAFHRCRNSLKWCVALRPYQSALEEPVASSGLFFAPFRFRTRSLRLSDQNDGSQYRAKLFLAMSWPLRVVFLHTYSFYFRPL